MATKTVVLIHGNFVTKRSWDPWVERYRARGHNVVALAYPGKEKSVEEQKRRYPDPTTAGVTINEHADPAVARDHETAKPVTLRTRRLMTSL